MPYVFNNFNNTAFENGFKENTDIINNVQEMWVNFARNGYPSTDKYFWDKYDYNTRKTMIIDKKIEMIEDYNGKQREILDPLIKYYLKGSISNLSYNVPIVYKLVGQIFVVLVAAFGLIYLLKKLF